ncbi:MAG: GNAT family N-acetyltransferase [Sporichthyaceae bacterium]
MSSAPILRTDRLHLRGWRPADRVAFADLNADPAVMEFMARGPLKRWESDAFADRIEAEWAERGYGLWAVEVVGGPEFVGYVGLHAAEFDAPFTPTVEVGWRLASEHWGHGYATEAARAALAWGCGERALPEVLSFTAAINRRSRSVMERIGLRYVPGGDFDHPAVPEGHPVRPHVLYRLSPEAEAGYRA